jgi:hypothetical protein
VVFDEQRKVLKLESVSRQHLPRGIITHIRNKLYKRPPNLGSRAIPHAKIANAPKRLFKIVQNCSRLSKYLNAQKATWIDRLALDLCLEVRVPALVACVLLEILDFGSVWLGGGVITGGNVVWVPALMASFLLQVLNHQSVDGVVT